MAEETHPVALERIERAIARIEVAAASNSAARETLARRHATLRTRVAEAIATLDAVAEPG